MISPERTLMLAIIAQAIQDAAHPKESIDRRRARKWLTVDSTDLRIICQCANIDFEYVLRKCREQRDADWPPVLFKKMMTVVEKSNAYTE